MREPILTVRQPWASAIFDAGKNVENRTWFTDYRGRIWIHASKRRDPAAVRDHRLQFVLDGLPAGVIIGSVDLIDVVERSRSRWAERDAFHWVLANPVPLARHVPRRGYPGLTWFDLEILD